jgi:hypothetical protein
MKKRYKKNTQESGSMMMPRFSLNQMLETGLIPNIKKIVMKNKVNRINSNKK